MGTEEDGTGSPMMDHDQTYSTTIARDMKILIEDLDQTISNTT